MEATDYVAVESFDVLLTDLKAEDIARIAVGQGVKHLSPAKHQNIDAPTTTIIKGTTFGENARILVMAVVSRSSSKQSQQVISPLNVAMLVDTGSPYVFLTAKTWSILGVKREDLPNDQAYVKINGVRVFAHMSGNHFQDIDILGASFLKFCKLTVDYPEATVELQISTAYKY